MEARGLSPGLLLISLHQWASQDLQGHWVGPTVYAAADNQCYKLSQFYPECHDVGVLCKALAPGVMWSYENLSFHLKRVSSPDDSGGELENPKLKGSKQEGRLSHPVLVELFLLSIHLGAVCVTPY